MRNVLTFLRRTRRVAFVAVPALLSTVILCAQTSQPSKAPKGTSTTESPRAADAQKGQNTQANQPAPAPPINVTVTAPQKSASELESERRQREQEIAIEAQIGKFTGWLVFVGVITALVVGWQAYETRRSASAAIRQVIVATSARIYIEGVTAVNFEPGQEPVFFVRVGNAGPVQAEDVKVSIEVKHRHGGSNQIAAWNSILIPANNYRDYPFRASFVLPVAMAELDTWNLTVSGTVTYKEKAIPYCYKYNQWNGPRPLGVPAFVPCDFDSRRNVTMVAQAGSYTTTGRNVGAVISKPAEKTEQEAENQGQFKDQP